MAAELRKRVPGLLGKGKLDRTARVIDKANRLCPASAPETWAAQVETLAELGRYAEARHVAREISSAPSAPAAATQAAKTALAKVERLDKTFPDTDEAKAQMRRLLGEAGAPGAKPNDEAALRASIDKYVAAWEAWRPNGDALVGAGLAAKAIGDVVNAQRFFDRAMVDLEKATGKNLELDVPLSRGRDSMAWSRDSAWLAVSQRNDISIIDALTFREPLRMRGHENTIYSIMFSPDGKQLASGSRDKTVRLWDASTGVLVKTLTGHTGSVSSVAFSRDGKQLASGSADTTVRLWDASTGALVKTFAEPGGRVRSIAFSPDGKHLASATEDSNVRLWDAANGVLVKTLKGHEEGVLSVAFSPDGKWLASGSEDHTVRLWNATTGTLSTDLPASWVSSVTFSPDGRSLIASGDALQVWHASTGKRLRNMRTLWWPALLSPDGTRLATPGVRVWDASSGALLKSLEVDIHGTMEVALSPDGKRLAVTLDPSIKGGARGYLWVGVKGMAVKSGNELENAMAPIAFSADGERLVSESSVSGVRVWDASTGALLKTLEGHRPVAFSPDGSHIASGSRDHAVQVWDASTGALLRTLQGHTKSVSLVVFSQDGKRLASGSEDGTVRLWDASTGALIETLQWYPSDASLAFSPDGKLLVLGSNDNDVRLWDATTGAPVATLRGHTDKVLSVRFSPDGKLLASGSSDKTIRLWDGKSGELLKTLQGHINKVELIAFSPDGRWLASGMRSRFSEWPPVPPADDVRLWDASTGEQIKVLPGTGAVKSLAFLPDGKALLFARRDGSTFLLRVPDGSQLATLRTLTGKDAGYIFTAGHIDFVGSQACAARSYAICLYGSLSFPLDVCEERVFSRGLLAKVLAGDTSYADPESESEPMRCEPAAMK